MLLLANWKVQGWLKKKLTLTQNSSIQRNQQHQLGSYLTSLGLQIMLGPASTLAPREGGEMAHSRLLYPRSTLYGTWLLRCLLPLSEGQGAP